MRSKYFIKQEVREIGRKEAGESIGFPILWVGLIKDIFHIKERNAKNRRDCKSMPEREKCFSME